MSATTTDPLPSRETAALAGACLLIDDARLYGLIDGGPEVDRERCEEILAGCSQRGIVPSEDEREEAMARLLAELGAVRG